MQLLQGNPIRGFTRRLSSGVGNFWVDLVRSTLYILLPLSLVVATGSRMIGT